MRRARRLQGPGRYRIWLLFAGLILLAALAAGIVGAVVLPETVRSRVEESLVLPPVPREAAPELLPAALRRNLVESAGLAWLLGLSPAGLPLIWLLLFWRGFQVGFAGAFLWTWSAGTSRALLVTLVPHNLVALPGLCLLVAALGRLSAALLRSLWQGRPLPRARLLGDGGVAVGATLMLVGASYVEAYLTPRLVALSLTLLP